jgi:chorismate-pyruvate lyase
MRLNDSQLYVAQLEEPPLLSSWLHHPHSLTDKLHSLTGASALQHLFEGWVLPSFWDRRMLGLNEKVYQREVLMNSKDQTAWYARTLIPKACYEANADFFGRLAHESMRDLIFGQTQVVAVQRVMYSVDKSCIEFYWVKNHCPNREGLLWVRYCEYRLGESSFHLFELLFPELGHLA